MAEQFGRSTNAIHWHVPNAYNVWAHASPEQAERYLRPALRGELRDAYAVTERDAGSDPSRIASTAEPTLRRLRAQRREVVRHLRRRRLGPDRDGERPRGRRAACRPCSWSRPAPRASRSIDEPRFTHSYPDGHPTIRLDSVEVAGGRGDRRRRQGRRAAAPLVHRGAARDRRARDRGDVAAARGDGRLGAGARAGRQPDLRLPGSQLPARRLGRRRRRRAADDDGGRAPRRRGRRPETGPRQGLDGEAVRLRGGLALRRPLRPGLRRPRLHALERRRALPARAPGRQDLGGDERDPAADRRPRDGAPRRRPASCTEAGREARPDAAPAPAIGRGRRRQRARGLLRRQHPAQPLRRRLRGRCLGDQPEARPGPRPALRGERRRSARAGRRGRRRDSGGGRRRRPRRSDRARLRRRDRHLRRVRRDRGGRATGARADRGRARPAACRSAGRTATGSSRSGRARRSGATRSSGCRTAGSR